MLICLSQKTPHAFGQAFFGLWVRAKGRETQSWIHVAFVAFWVLGPLVPDRPLLAQSKLQGAMDPKILQNQPASGRFYAPSGAFQGRAETRNGTTRYYDSSGWLLGSK